MGNLLFIAIAYQLLMVASAPSGLSAESLLAGRAIAGGAIPYRDFALHIGPLPGYLFAALFSVPSYAWCSIIFVAFNLLSAWGIYRLGVLKVSEREAGMAAILFLFVIPLFGGQQMYSETMMATFGIWAFYYAEQKQWWASGALCLCAVATKLTGFIYPLAILSLLW